MQRFRQAPSLRLKQKTMPVQERLRDTLLHIRNAHNFRNRTACHSHNRIYPDTRTPMHRLPRFD